MSFLEWYMTIAALAFFVFVYVKVLWWDDWLAKRRGRDWWNERRRASNQDSERHGPDGLRKNPSVGLPGKAPVPDAGAQIQERSPE